MPERNRRPQPRKDDFYVRVSLPDNTTQWFPASDFVGSDKPMPFSKPLATCAVRVFDDVVAFSHLLVRRKAASSLSDKPISMPSAALTRLAKRSGEFDLSRDDVLIVERAVSDNDGNLTNVVYPFTLTRDENNIVTLELVDVAADEAEKAANDADAVASGEAAQAPDAEGETVTDREVITLSRGAEKISVYLRSPKVDRVIAIAWIGHFGRPPGDPETITRCAAKILNALRDLPVFSALSDIEQVRVPALAGSTQAAPTLDITSASTELPVHLYDTVEQPLGAGTVTVTFDLSALVSSELRLAYQVTPSEQVAEAFSDEHRTQLEWAIRSELLRHARSDIESVVFDVTLGEVEDSSVERLITAFTTHVPGVHLAPDKYVTFEQAPPA